VLRVKAKVVNSLTRCGRLQLGVTERISDNTALRAESFLIAARLANLPHRDFFLHSGPFDQGLVSDNARIQDTDASQ